MPTINIVQPKIRQLCGVSDHSEILAAGLRGLGRDTTIIDSLALSGSQNGDAQSAILLQVSIYGFNSRGVPLQLLGALSKWKAEGRSVAAYFHELWVPEATPRRSAFWLKPLQRMICREIALRADVSHFNSMWAFNWGQRLVGERAHYSPTFSNVGEPVEVAPISLRHPTLVVFGSAITRTNGYRALLPYLDKLIGTGAIAKIIDIGPNPSLVSTLNELKQYQSLIDIVGPAPAPTISRYLSRAKLGLHYTPWAQTSKSGIYAALISHGVLPLSVHPVLEDAAVEPFRDTYVIHQSVSSFAHSYLGNSAECTSQLQDRIQAARSAYKSSSKLATELADQLR